MDKESLQVIADLGAFSPHDLRRSCVSYLLAAGSTSGLVQRFVGHANITTTVRYDCRGEQTKKKAAKSLHVPFVTPEPPS
jgi:integrase/recombinase XerD